MYIDFTLVESRYRNVDVYDRASRWTLSGHLVVKQATSSAELDNGERLLLLLLMLMVDSLHLVQMWAGLTGVPAGAC